MAHILTTDGVDPRNRVAYWREVVCRTFIELEVTQAAPERFRGLVSSARIGPVRIARLRTDPMTAVRTRAHLRMACEELCLVAERGVAIPDTTAIPVSSRTTVGRIAFPFVLDIARATSTSAPPDSHDQLASMLLDVLASALDQRRPATASTVSDQEILIRLRLYANAHLSDPDLNPTQAAAATNISVRQLHRLFAREKTTFGQWVREQRLRCCHHDLSTAELASTPIGTIARRWGFRDLPTLSRAFRAEYGISPREHRSTSTGPRT